MKKVNKFKTGGLIALLLSGMAVGSFVYNNNKSNQTAQEPKKIEKEFKKHKDDVVSVQPAIEQNYDSFDNRLKEEIRSMSEKELIRYIKDSDEVLAELQKTIDSDETNPEERFEARTAYREIKNTRDLMQTELNKRQNARMDAGRGERN